MARKLLLTLLLLLFDLELFPLLFGACCVWLFALFRLFAGGAGVSFAGLAVLFGIIGAIILLIVSVTIFVAVFAGGNSIFGIDGTGTLPPVKNINREKSM